MKKKKGAAKFLGLLAVEKRWLKAEALDGALKVQAEKGGFIGSVLLSEGLINQKQLDLLLSIQEDAEAREDEYLFGIIAVENKLITAQQLLQALGEQKADFFRKNIGEILVGHDWLTPKKCEAVAKAQKRLHEKKEVSSSKPVKASKSKCPKCTHVYLINDPERCRKVRCKKCGYVFEIGTKELRASSSQLIRLKESTAKASESGTNLFFEYLAENDLIDDAQLKELDHNSQGQRYCVGEEIARGGMGVILSTVDSNLRREIVTKVHLKNKSRLATMRFIEEAQITGQLEHPNIPPVYDLGLNKENNLFFTMKHIRGETLESIIDGLASGNPKTEAKYPVNQIINIFLKVCDALNYAHHKNVLHRDIKPENIMIGEFGEVLLMDWGLAKIIGSTEEVEDFSSDDADKISSVRADDALSQTMEGTTAGTPVFMPPEQALGRMDELDERSDLYSLGASFYYAIALQKPIVGSSVREILSDAAHGNVRPVPDHVPVELASIIRKSMEEKPRNRYATIKEFEDDLVKYQRGYSVSVKHDNIFGTIKKLYKRNKLIFLLSSILGAIILVGSVVSVTMLSQQRNKAFSQRQKAEKALSETEILLAKFDEEKSRRKSDNFESAPSYFLQAQLDITNKKYGNAMSNINLAIQYDSLNPKYHCLKAGLFLFKKDFGQAIKGFEHCLKMKYMKVDIQRLLSHLKLPKNSKVSAAEKNKRLIGHLLKLKLFGLAETYSGNIETSLWVWRSKLSNYWSKGNYSLVLSLGKKVQLRLSNNIGGKDLGLLRGMKINEIIISRSNVNTLDFAEGMPLESILIYESPSLKNLDMLSKHCLRTFSLRDSPVDNIDFLKNSQLESLHLGRCGVTSLEPLRGQPIKVLKLSFIKIEDMNVLKSFKLKDLFYSLKFIKNLAFLRGIKLKRFSSSWSTLGDISALNDLPLEYLSLYRSRLKSQPDFSKLKLKELSYYDMKISSFDFVLQMKTLERFSFSPKKGMNPSDWQKILKRHPNKNFRIRSISDRKKLLTVAQFADEVRKRAQAKKRRRKK